MFTVTPHPAKIEQEKGRKGPVLLFDLKELNAV